MSTKTKRQAEAEYGVLQQELERRYGPALAQGIIDEIRKAEKLAQYVPGYMPVKAASEILETFRGEARDCVQRLKNGRNTRKNGGASVIELETGRLRQESKRLLILYFQAQRVFYRLYRRAMASYTEETPATRRYKKRGYEPEMARAA